MLLDDAMTRRGELQVLYIYERNGENGTGETPTEMLGKVEEEILITDPAHAKNAVSSIAILLHRLIHPLLPSLALLSRVGFSISRLRRRRPSWEIQGRRHQHTSSLHGLRYLL